MKSWISSASGKAFDLIYECVPFVCCINREIGVEFSGDVENLAKLFTELRGNKDSFLRIE